MVEAQNLFAGYFHQHHLVYAARIFLCHIGFNINYQQAQNGFDSLYIGTDIQYDDRIDSSVYTRQIFQYLRCFQQHNRHVIRNLDIHFFIAKYEKQRDHPSVNVSPCNRVHHSPSRRVKNASPR